MGGAGRALEYSEPSTKGITMTAETTITQHTPGPWTLERGERGELDIVADGMSLIATANDAWNQPGFEGQADANARLIAAAPALLDALHGWIGTLDPFHDDNGNRICMGCDIVADADDRIPFDHDDDCLFAASLDAIEAATGRRP